MKSFAMGDKIRRYSIIQLRDICIWIMHIKRITSLKKNTYRKVSNIRRTLVENKIVDHSDVVGASPVGAAPTTSSFST